MVSLCFVSVLRHDHKMVSLPSCGRDVCDRKNNGGGGSNHFTDEANRDFFPILLCTHVL